VLYFMSEICSLAQGRGIDRPVPAEALSEADRTGPDDESSMTGQTSVVIPCYNCQRYLPEALESVCRQTRAAREIIIVDDGSRIPVQPPRNWKGPPLRVARRTNGGIAAARNLGISLATGQFVALLDADDAWAPRKLELQEGALTRSPGAVACFTPYTEKPGWLPCNRVVYPAADVPEDEFWKLLWHRCFLKPSSMMLRRDVVQRLGGFESDLRYCEDLEFWFRLLREGHFVQVPEPLCYYRMHPNQVTKNMHLMATYRRRARLRIMARHRDRLEEAGIPVRAQLRDARTEYRADVLNVYFHHDSRRACPLLWKYAAKYPRDLRIWKYALLSCLPRRVLLRLRGEG
jgi:glycosyltransferase involved in cell wall biosynthesis